MHQACVRLSAWYLPTFIASMTSCLLPSDTYTLQAAVTTGGFCHVGAPCDGRGGSGLKATWVIGEQAALLSLQSLKQTQGPKPILQAHDDMQKTHLAALLPPAALGCVAVHECSCCVDPLPVQQDICGPC